MKKNAIKKLFAAMTATALSVSAFSAVSLTSADAAGTQVGQAYLMGSFGTEGNWAAGENEGVNVATIDGNAQYECIWKVSEATATGDSFFLTVVIEPVGVDNFTTDTFPNLEATLDEVWIDGVKLSDIDTSAAVDTHYYDNGGFTRLYVRGDWAGNSTKIIADNTIIEDEVRVRFTLSGLDEDGTSNVTEDPVPLTKLGDVNSDKSVDSSDAALILKHYAAVQGSNPANMLSDEAVAVADYNKDTNIDSSDAAMILKAYAEQQSSK